MPENQGPGSTGHRHPTEVERALRAVVLGAALGFVLSLLGRRRGR